MNGPEVESKSITLRQYGVIGALLLFFFTFNIWNYDLWHTDELRFAQVSREMIQSGNYLAPQVNEKPYREKPPLLFWGIALISKPFGDVTGESARFVLALAALATLAFTFLLARDMFDQRTAIWAVIMLSTSWRFFWQARTVQIDMLITACTTASLLMLWLWYRKKERKFLYLFYFVIGMGMLAKGPPALIFPLLALLVFFWKNKDVRKKTYWPIGFLSSIGLFLVWLIPARMAVPSIGTKSVQGDILSNAYRQTIGRMMEGVGHANPPWYYLHTIPVDLMPWAFLLPFALLYMWRQRKESDAHKLLLCWTIPAFIFFSLCTGKRSVYLLPILPALAIGMAAYWSAKSESFSTKAYIYGGYIWLGLIGLFTTAAAYFSIYTPEGIERLPLILSALALGGMLISGYTIIRKSPRQFLNTFAAQVVLFFMLIAYAYFPINNARKSVRDFCKPLHELSVANEPYSLYLVGRYKAKYNFYTSHSQEFIFYSNVRFESDKDTIRDRFEDLAKDYGARFDSTEHQQEWDTVNQKVQAFRNELRTTDQEKYYDWMQQDLDFLLSELTSEHSTFILLEEEDYIWITMLEPKLKQYTILQYDAKGKDKILLLANNASASLSLQIDTRFAYRE